MWNDFQNAALSDRRGPRFDVLSNHEKRATPSADSGSASRTGVLLFPCRKRRTKKKTSPGRKRPWDFFGLSGGGGFCPCLPIVLWVIKSLLPQNHRNGARPDTSCFSFCCRTALFRKRQAAAAKEERKVSGTALPAQKAAKRGGKPKHSPRSGASRIEAAGSSPKVSQRARDPPNDPKGSFGDQKRLSFGPCTARFLWARPKENGGCSPFGPRQKKFPHRGCSYAQQLIHRV